MSKVQLHAYIVLVLVGFALLGAKAIKPLKEGKVITDFSSIPMDIGEWSGIDSRFSEETYRLLPSCSLLLRVYDHPEISPVELAIVYGTNLGDFHQPDQCLTGQGLRTERQGKVQIKGEDGKPFEANSLIMESDYEGRRAFVYWFSSHGTTATFLGSYKTKVFASRLLSRKVEPSAMVRLSVQVNGDDKEAIGHLVQFGGTIVPYLNREFTKGTSAVQP